MRKEEKTTKCKMREHNETRAIPSSLAHEREKNNLRHGFFLLNSFERKHISKPVVGRQEEGKTTDRTGM